MELELPKIHPSNPSNPFTLGAMFHIELFKMFHTHEFNFGLTLRLGKMEKKPNLFVEAGSVGLKKIRQLLMKYVYFNEWYHTI